jgi:hypothetical protein
MTGMRDLPDGRANHSRNPLCDLPDHSRMIPYPAKTATEEAMVDRRTFTTLLLGGIAAPKVSLAADSKAKNVFYASIGPELTLYSVDVDGAALVKHDTISTPMANWNSCASTISMRANRSSNSGPAW